MIPLSIMLAYYLDGNTSVIDEILSKDFNFKFKNRKIYEILSGVDSTVASTFLDSTIKEAGIGIPVLHYKYDLIILNKCYDDEIIND